MGARVPVWSTGVITTATRHDVSAHQGYHRFFSTLWPLLRYNIPALTVVDAGVLTGINTQVAADCCIPAVTGRREFLSGFFIFFIFFAAARIHLGDVEARNVDERD